MCRRKIFILLLAAMFVVSFYGCENISALFKWGAKKKEKEIVAQPKVVGTVIAKVNNTPLTLEDLTKEIDAYNTIVSEDRPEAKITTRDQKISYLKEEMVRRSLLYQEALARGLDRKEEIIQALEKTKQDLLVMELVREEAEKVEVSSKEIEDYYNDYKEQLKEPEERQIREIIVSTEQEAKETLIQLLQGQDFATLAREKSKAASAKDGGDLGFIPRGKKSTQFDAVAFSDTLEVGGISSVFKVPEGYSIIKLESKRGGQQKTLTEMWNDIKRALTFLKQQETIDKLITKLSTESKIEIYEGEIK